MQHAGNPDPKVDGRQGVPIKYPSAQPGSLTRIEYCPARSPVSFSSRFEGGRRKIIEFLRGVDAHELPKGPLFDVIRKLPLPGTAWSSSSTSLVLGLISTSSTSSSELQLFGCSR